MSLIPTRSLSAALPVFFIEARMFGQPDAILTQFGLSLDADKCNFALFTRTSGVLLVAGVGSYVAYRMFARLFGRDFMWTMVEQARVDLLSRADVRLLHPANVGIGSRETDAYSCVLADDECSDSQSEGCSGLTKHTYLSTDGSSPHRRRLLRRSSRGHPRVPCCSTPLAGTNPPARFSTQNETDSTTEGSVRHYRIYHRRLSACTRSESAASKGLSQVSESHSDHSASLRLLWDDLEWDQETDFPPPDVLRRGQSPVPSNISEFSEFRSAKRIFGETASLKVGEGDGVGDCRSSEAASMRDDASESLFGSFIEKTCMGDSTHLYGIVAGCITSSDALSMCSEQSTRSFLSLRNRSAAAPVSCGLLELTNCTVRERPQDVGVGMFSSLTDSAISKGTVASSSVGPQQNTCTMFDSAIGTDFLSSEDEGAASVAVLRPSAAAVVVFDPPPDNTVIRRAALDRIREFDGSSLVSERSLEWCYDDDIGPPLVDDAHFADSVAMPSKTDVVASRASTSSEGDRAQRRNGERSPRCSPSPRRVPRVPHSRDLMVWARERFTADSPQFKMLQGLYSSKKRLKRIGMKRSDEASDQFISSLLHSMLYHRRSIFRCKTFEDLQKAVSFAFAKFDFLRQWPFVRSNAEQKSPLELREKDASASDALALLRTLWDVDHASWGGRSESLEDVQGYSDAVRFLAILRVISVFEVLEGQNVEDSARCDDAPLSLYARFFATNNLRQIVERIGRATLDEEVLVMLTDTLCIRVEVWNCTRTASDETPTLSVYPERNSKCPTVTFLKADAKLFFPLYEISSE